MGESGFCTFYDDGCHFASKSFNVDIVICHKVQANGLGLAKLQYSLLQTYVIYSDTKRSTIIISVTFISLLSPFILSRLNVIKIDLDATRLSCLGNNKEN